MENNKKWYVFESGAEGSRLFVCDLSPEEIEVIKHFLKCAQNVEFGNIICDEGYSGWIMANGSKGYDSKEAALKALKEDSYYSYMFNSNEMLLKL